MKNKYLITGKWKLIICPFITFIIVFAVSRSLFPLFKDWTWKATIYGCACGLIAALVDFLKLMFTKEH